ncbi:MAG: rod shape-determining protein MreD [Alkalilacustris sp.]
MAEPAARSPWRHWALFAGLAGLTLFWRMLPLGAGGPGLPGPDLIACLAMAWVLRRPDYVPAVLIVALVLLEDLLLMRPPGLWALMVLLGTEFLRARQPGLRELPFAVEWAFVAAVLGAMWLADRLVLALLMVPVPALGGSLVQLLVTALCYPLVVLASHVLLGVRKPAAGETDALGRPL